MARKKLRKTKGERLAESFFPVDESDVKYAVEIPVKEYERRVMESFQRKKQKKYKKSSKKKAKKKTSKRKGRTTKADKVKAFNPKNIKLKKEGYELIITEKPQAASKIADALSNGKAKKKIKNRVAYYEFEKDGNNVVVGCAVGHLFTLKQTVKGSDFPIFDVKWVPNFIANKKDFTKRYHDALLALAKKAGSLTVATDYDVEGELIGLNVVRFIATQPDAKRMKFSTLTKKELDESYEDKMKSVDWGQAIAGETRHYLDWYYGINLSRALMNAIKTTGSFKLMSIGRVQGPALKLIVEKEKEIQDFTPEPYWKIYANVSKNGEETSLVHNKDIFDEKQLESFKELEGKEAEAKTKIKTIKLKPNPPFNLTSLQTEAYKYYKLTPSKTLQLAQSLYLNGYISYPRTSSQKLPISIGYKEILKKIAKQYKVESLITRKKPIEGKKSDPAHPSIFPTGELTNKASLSPDEKKVYDLISKRFLALFMPDAVKENKRVELEKDDKKFYRKGSFLKEKGWAGIYPTTIKEEKIPDLEGKVKIEKIKFEEKETQPPKRYSPASIVSKLEKKNLGTKATRSSILDTLYNRDYIKGTSIQATALGISLVETLEKNSPIILDESLTRKFEKQIETLQDSIGKKGDKSKLEKKEKDILDKAKKTIEDISKDFKKKQKEIGRELLEANIEFREKQQVENRLRECPKCKKGNLTIKYSRKTKRYFVACDAYPDCKNTFTLPPKGLMKPAKKGDGKMKCEECGWPMIMSIRKGKRPWIFCFNPECPTNKERIEAYKKKQAKIEKSKG